MEEKEMYICNDCGYEWEEETDEEVTKCPRCGNENIDLLYFKESVDKMIKSTFLFDLGNQSLI